MTLLQHIICLLQRNEEYQAKYFKECMRQKTPNIIICPNSTEMPLHLDPSGLEDWIAVNEGLKKVRRNIKKQFARKAREMKKKEKLN